MKLAIRVFAFCVVVAGVAAAATSPKTAPFMPSHQSATATFPIPQCGPNTPPGSGCVASPSSAK